MGVEGVGLQVGGFALGASGSGFTVWGSGFRVHDVLRGLGYFVAGLIYVARGVSPVP